MTIVYLVTLAFLWVLPAYVANAVPVLLGGGKPLDFGKKFSDGTRIFGDGKTIRGCFAGIVAGSFIGFVEGYLLFGFLLAFGAIVGDASMAEEYKKKATVQVEIPSLDN